MAYNPPLDNVNVKVLDVYREGYEAARMGENLSKNPYPHKDAEDLHYWWYVGWSDMEEYD